MFSKTKIVSSFLCAVAGSKSAHFHLGIMAGQEKSKPKGGIFFLLYVLYGVIPGLIPPQSQQSVVAD